MLYIVIYSYIVIQLVVIYMVTYSYIIICTVIYRPI